MGDGITKRVALIINGDIRDDTKRGHLRNVEQAVARFRHDGFDEVHVVGTEAAAHATTFTDIRRGPQALHAILDGFKGTLDDDDVLSVYVTGHGDLQQGSACVVTPGYCVALPDLARRLDAIPHGYRTLFMDQCIAGQDAHRFVSEKTTLVTLGSPGETVSCQRFTPHFFSDKVPDTDGDGILTMRERYAHSVSDYGASTTLFYSAGRATDLAGRPARTAPFPQAITKVATGEELTTALRTLKPGQLALVNFSADWCHACTAYEPAYDQLAERYGGAFLMIQAKGVDGSDKDWLAYGVRALPTVAFVDWQGNVFPVDDRHHPEASLPKTVMTPEAYTKVLEARFFAESKPEGQSKLLDTIAAVGAAGVDSLTTIGHAVFAGRDEALQASYLSALSNATWHVTGTDKESLGALFWTLTERYPQAVYKSMDACGTFGCRFVGYMDWRSRKAMEARADDLKTPTDVRKTIIIWRSGDEQANFALLQSDPDPAIRRVAARALNSYYGQWRSFVERAVIIAQQDADPIVRALVIYGLAREFDKPPSIYRTLCQGLRDPHREVRDAAANGMEQIHLVALGSFTHSELKDFEILQEAFHAAIAPFARVVLARTLLRVPKEQMPVRVRRELVHCIKVNVKHQDRDVRAQASAALRDIPAVVIADRQYLCDLIQTEHDLEIRTTLMDVLSKVADATMGAALQQRVTALVVANLFSDHAELTDSALALASQIAQPSAELVEKVMQGLYAARNAAMQVSHLRFFEAHPNHFSATMEEDLTLLDSRDYDVVLMTLRIIEKSTPGVRAVLRPKIARLVKLWKQELQRAAQSILTMDRPTRR